ncbi:MAG TPA: glycosyltransferase [Pyrinomonadaceae bacterium]|nr:glycosyltransferase [Pyrinomonadaceae bacterium]
MSRNVLQLVSSFHQGGSERQAVQLARLLKESGRYEVRVACLDGGGALREEAERLGVGEIPEYKLNNFYDRQLLAQLRRFARHLRRERIAVVHAHDFYTNVFGMLGAAWARVPARVASRRETGGVRTPAQKWVERRAYGLAHAVVANASAVREQLAREGVAGGKVTVVHNGLDTERLRPRPNLARGERLALVGLPAELAARPLVTIVANMRFDVKDHPTFLRAARRVREEVSSAAFVLAGEGELTEPLRALAAELGLGESAFFTGRCAHVAELLEASDVCVLSSKAEGFSNAILEYMAASRPVVATDVGGAREAVAEGETGYLVAPGDDERLASRVAGLLKNPEEARAMGARGRARVEREFSCAAQLERTEQLYERLLRPSARTFEARPLAGREGVSENR